MAEIHLTDDTFDQDVIQSASPVLVDFWAPWCGPCRMLAPLLEELSKEYTGKVVVARSTPTSTQRRQPLQDLRDPTLLFFKGGKVVEQMVGVHSKAEIKKTLDNLVAA